MNYVKPVEDETVTEDVRIITCIMVKVFTLSVPALLLYWKSFHTNWVSQQYAKITIFVLIIKKITKTVTLFAYHF